MSTPDPAAPCPTCSDTDYGSPCTCRQDCGHSLCLGMEQADPAAPFAGATALDIPASAVWPALAPDREVISCGPCGEKFAADPAAAFTSPLLAAAITDAVTAAGWQQDGETWTCTVCLAKAGKEPGPEPAGPEAHEPAEHEPAPDTDPYDQYHDMSIQLDADVQHWWDDNNQKNSVAHWKIYARLDDAQIRIAELSGRRAAA